MLPVVLALIVVAATALWLALFRNRRPDPASAPDAAVARAASADAPAPRGPMLILWGSQTGTAEGFSRTLEREARERGFAAKQMDLEVRAPRGVHSARRGARASER